MGQRGSVSVRRTAILGSLMVIVAGSVLLLSATRSRATAASACARSSQLAYSAGTYAGQRATIWVANADGSGRHRLLPAAHPVLAPNGRLLTVTDFSRSAALGLYTVCGTRVSQFLPHGDTVVSVAWSPDSLFLAAVVGRNPDNAPFHEQLDLINVLTGQVSTVARGFLGGWGGPSFAPDGSHQLAYANVPKAGQGTNLWSVAPGGRSVQLTRGDSNQYPVWGPTGLLYQRNSSTGTYLARYAGGRSSNVMKLDAWPVAVSADGRRLAAESAACGVVWPVSVNLSTRRIVHQFPSSFAPYGISPSGGSILIAGSTPTGDCGGPRSRIETVPFGGGRPTLIAYGVDPSWADSRVAGVQP